MMRRGLWQQKQRHPSASVLCRFSYSYGPYTRPSLRPSSTPDARLIDSVALSHGSTSASSYSTRSYTVAAGRSRHGGLENPRKSTGLGELAAVGTGRRTCRRTFKAGALPSWATQQVQPTANNDGLLPHERAARERAMAGKQPPPATPAEPLKSPDSDDGLIPHERLTRRVNHKPRQPPKLSRAARPVPSDDSFIPGEPGMIRYTGRGPSSSGTPSGTARLAPSNDSFTPRQQAPRERVMAREQLPPTPAEAPQSASVEKPTSQPAAPPRSAPAAKNRAPAWASAVPSWSVPPAQPAAAASDPATPPEQANTLAFLLPHERAAREKAAARTASSPHKPATNSAFAARSNVFSPLDDFSRELGSLQSRRRRPLGTTGTGTTSALESTESVNARGRLPNQTLSSLYDLARSTSGGSRAPAEGGEWKNLARRERRLPPGFGAFNPESTLRPAPSDPWKMPQSSGLNTAGDPFSLLTQRVDPQTSQGSSSLNSSDDPWKVLEQTTAAKPSKAQKKRNAIADEQTWAWTQDYAEEAKQVQVQRIARELQQKAEPAEEQTGSAFAPSRRHERERDDRYRRADRYGRDERGDREDRRDQPKKPKVRRRQDEEDDDWDDEFYEEKRRRKAERAERERQRSAALEAAGPTPIFLPEYISVSNLADALGQKIDSFVAQLEELGFEEVSKDNILTGETAALVAQEYGFEPTVDAGEAEDLKPAPPPADPSSLPLRPPVVTIMGHVDHGKTTLLDYLRKSSIVAQEHGGITQHIGAFSVSLSSGKQITFLDTPGHAAFLSMRQRGANVTDMVILVVAADDSVMPQTLEALKHARAAKVPIIVAINKVDKPEANVDRVKADLANNGVEIEDYGGDVQVVCVSGKTGQGMDDLEENILLLSEMLDIRAETEGLAEGWVLESTIKPIGRVATILVKRGTLRPGDFIVAGRVHAKIRSLRNEAGVEVEEAPPGTAIEVLGWKEPPDAGDQVLQAPDEGRAKAAVHYRQELKERGEVIAQMAQQEQDRRERERERERERALAEAANPNPRNRRHHHHQDTDLDALAAAEGEQDPADTTIYVPFIVKGDVHGSVEAVTAALLEQGNNEIRAKVLVSAPGHITESDVEHAAVSGSAIVNFNNAVPAHIKRLAGDAGVKILEHNVIYHLVEEVRERLAEALPPLVIKKVVGEAEVLQVFPINIKGRKYKNIAGCRIGNGAVKRGSKARVIREGENIFEGVIETLKHVKKDVTEMKKGSECGMSFADWDELQAGDHIQVIEEITEKRKL